MFLHEQSSGEFLLYEVLESSSVHLSSTTYCSYCCCPTYRALGEVPTTVGVSVDQWVCWLLTGRNSPIMRLQGHLKSDTPLPGERRAGHETAAWYAEQVGLAAQKADAPLWLDILVNGLGWGLVGVLGWSVFVWHLPIMTIATITLISLAVSMWTLSSGLHVTSGSVWRAMALHLIALLHESTPHNLQPDCFDYSCQAQQANHDSGQS